VTQPSWFRRKTERVRSGIQGGIQGVNQGVNQGSPPPSGGAPGGPAPLLQAIHEMNRFINQNSGRLPGEAVVNARRLTDTLREVIATSDVRPLDVYAEMSVRSTLSDYLPTTLRGYLAVAATGGPATGPASRSLIEQLEALQSAADLVLVAARDQDVDALMTQGNFLRTKFSGSDLDL
jgi:hypothetical protein